MFTRVDEHPRANEAFPSVNRRAERQVERNMEEEEESVTDMAQRSPLTTARRMSVCLDVPRVRERYIHSSVSVPYPAHSAS